MSAKAKTYVFGDFRFIPSESLLLKGDAAVALPHKALNLLEKLVESAGSVVTKDELIRDVWDDLAIEESAVARTVFLVRAALGDDPKNHIFIQTVPKRGYRFVADVSTVNGANGHGALKEKGADDVSAARSEEKPRSIAKPRRFSLVSVSAGSLLVVALATGAFFSFFGSASEPARSSLLIMPLTSAGDPTGDALLEDGIADALIYQLAANTNISIRSLSVTRSYSGSNVDPVQAGREQRVQRVFVASYQRADGILRILARLINVETGESEESYRFDTSETTVFAIQDAVAAEIGNRIARRLGAAYGSVRVSGTANEEAYRSYLQGMALFDKRNSLKAVESFERAIELDPNYARAWVGKAVALGGMPALGDSSSRELFDRTVIAVDRALALDPRSAEAYSALCAAKLTYAHDLTGAEKACDRAMELAPNSPIVLQNYSFLLNCQGRFDEAMQAITRGLDVEPMSFLSQTQYAQSLHFARRYDEAYSQYVRLIELQPDRMPTYEWLVRALEASGRYAEAMEWLVKSLKGRNADESQIADLQRAYQSAGWPGVLSERLKMNQNSLNYFRQAGLNARLGNKDAAFEFLEKAYAQRSPVFVTLAVEPQFDPIRDDPRFIEIVNRMRFGAQ